MEITDTYNNAGRRCTVLDTEIVEEVTFQKFGVAPGPRSFVVVGSDDNGNYLYHEDIPDVLYQTKDVTELY